MNYESYLRMGWFLSTLNLLATSCKFFSLSSGGKTTGIWSEESITVQISFEWLTTEFFSTSFSICFDSELLSNFRTTQNPFENSSIASGIVSQQDDLTSLFYKCKRWPDSIWREKNSDFFQSNLFFTWRKKAHFRVAWLFRTILHTKYYLFDLGRL